MKCIKQNVKISYAISLVSVFLGKYEIIKINLKEDKLLPVVVGRRVGSAWDTGQGDILPRFYKQNIEV